jgi:hypothetical protein
VYRNAVIAVLVTSLYGTALVPQPPKKASGVLIKQNSAAEIYAELGREGGGAGEGGCD